MIELRHDELLVHHPEVHPDARTSLHLQRTLRIPDDDRTYPLPAGLGRFPVRHVDDHADRVPDAWRTHGGVMVPMYQSEALWISFTPGEYPFALKIAAGKVCAITGEPFREGLDPDVQDYVVVPGQPWLDGFAVEKGVIRQFVAMPLGAGYTAEEQLTGEAEWGGLQIVAHPMRADRWEALLEQRRRAREQAHLHAAERMAVPPAPMAAAAAPTAADMGLAPGGRMHQVIHPDPYGVDAWDRSVRSRVFVHLCNSLVWRAVTGSEPPTTPPTAAEYERAGLPWFSRYEETAGAAGGGARLGRLRSVLAMGKAKGDVPLPDNTSVEPGHVVPLPSGHVRDGDF
jgi:hypothetical protein